MIEEYWTDWIAHDDCCRPADMQPDDVVLCDLSGDIIGPAQARCYDWHYPGDPVCRYKKKQFRLLEKVEVELANAL